MLNNYLYNLLHLSPSPSAPQHITMSSPASTKPSRPSLRQKILHLLLARPSSPTLNLSNVSRFLNSASGLDKGLMVIQYPAKIVVALLVALAARLVTLDKRGKAGLGMQVLQRVAVTWAARFKALSSSIGDARTMMRLLGASFFADKRK